uniref:LolA-like domain-containing protein n=1 Tax=Biomphalaria glabrata TaxID=6526 RepID=A0A2C9KRQ4_BIOGL
MPFFYKELGWTSSSPLQQVPLRIEIEGYTTSLGIGVTAGPGVPTISPNSPRHFHHMYDFINYLPYIDADPSIFETPPGIVCRKRVNTHPLPQFKNSFTYRTEIVDSNSELITHYAVWYNGDLKMVREDKRTVNPDPVLNTKDAITEIHDFETGNLGKLTISLYQNLIIFWMCTIVGTGVREPFIREAFNSLAQAVAAGKFIVMIPNFSMGDNEPQKAINVKILSGQPLKNKTLPMLPTQFSYRLETVLPQLNRVVETFVWYDSMMDIVRYDTRDAYSSTPVMTTYIHDFVTGVAYQINQVTKQCFIKPIAQGSFDVVTGQTTQDGSLIVSLKSPQSMFYLDDSYIYVGEKTVRGILCDVFESRRKDFKIGAYNISSSSVFKFYFQSAVLNSLREAHIVEGVGIIR